MLCTLSRFKDGVPVNPLNAPGKYKIESKYGVHGLIISRLVSFSPHPAISILIVSLHFYPHLIPPSLSPSYTSYSSLNLYLTIYLSPSLYLHLYLSVSPLSLHLYLSSSISPSLSLSLRLYLSISISLSL